jgi:hypothetical protein
MLGVLTPDCARDRGVDEELVVLVFVAFAAEETGDGAIDFFWIGDS